MGIGPTVSRLEIETLIQKALVGLVGAFSVIVKTDCGTDGTLHSTR